MRTKVVIDPLLQYSIKELDYLYYVEGMSKDMIRDQGPNKIEMAFLPSDSDEEALPYKMQANDQNEWFVKKLMNK